MNSEEKQYLRLSNEEEEGPLAPLGKTAWVQCAGFRTLAYLDEAGVWRTLSNGRRLEEPVKLIEGQ